MIGLAGPVSRQAKLEDCANSGRASTNRITAALVRTMDFAQRYMAAVDFAELDRARFILDRTHAFTDPREADAAGIRLMLPTPEILSAVSNE